MYEWTGNELGIDSLYDSVMIRSFVTLGETCGRDFKITTNQRAVIARPVKMALRELSSLEKFLGLKKPRKYGTQGERKVNVDIV